MLKNYLKIALRSLHRQKLYAVINIFSLSIGIACCLLILLYVRDELSFDRFHEQADEIYRVYRVEERTNGQRKVSEGTPAPLAPALVTDLPNVERAVRLRTEDALVRHGEKVFMKQVLFADPSFFEMFSFPLHGGPQADLLRTPDGVVLSAEVAATYFGNDNPIGQTLSVQLGGTFDEVIVAGVAEAFPSNSSITFEVLLPFARVPRSREVEEDDSWSSFTNATYVLLAEGTDGATVQQQLDRLVPQYFGAIIEAEQASGWWKPGDDVFRLRLQPLTDMHLNPGIDSFSFAVGNPVNSYILGGIALMVLLLACVNFTTLASGRAVSRAREVGVRKTLGAHRLQLMKQFWGEALLLSGFALLMGVVLAELLLPVFNTLADKDLTLPYADAPLILLSLGVLTMLSGFVAGSYPALILSSYRPANVLKGHVKANKGVSFTRALIVFQFTISIALIAGTLVMYDQLDYVKTKNLGFADEEVVAVTLSTSGTEAEATLDRFAEQIARHSGILSVSGTSYAFGGNSTRTAIQHEGQQHIVYLARVDPEYLATMDITLQAGRNFSDDLETDREGAVLVNETFAREFGWDDPVGRPLPEFEDVTIIGVVEDFHYQSLHVAIEPMILHMSAQLGPPTYALVRVHTDRVAETLAFLGDRWKHVAPGVPFDYQFLDQRLEQLYQAEERWSRIVQYAAVLAILIACLGLFGLTTLNAVRRTKEIGVRKVLGASVTGITVLLAKDFARLVVVAFVVGAPVAYIVMGLWLDGFAYHIALSWETFLLAGSLTLAIALLTVSYQAIKAALSNPVKALRYE